MKVSSLLIGMYLETVALKNGFKIPIHNKCVIISFIALICVISISLFPSVINENLAKGLLDSSGKDLFLCLLFICFLGTIGCTVLFYKINE
ncbi:MAG: hypothetical protein ACI9Z4_001810 [Polaribacter sp.]